MGHIEHSRHLAGSPDAVYAVVSDPQTWDKWFTVHERWMTDPPAAFAVGQSLAAKVVMLGMANKFEWHVDAVEAPSKLALSATGMAGAKVNFTFNINPAADGGTNFTVSGDFEGALIKGALGKALEKDGSKQLEKSLDQLDALAKASA